MQGETPGGNEVVGLHRHGRCGVIAIDNPPVNALGTPVRTGLVSALEAARRDDAVEAIILIGRGRSFPAGADIREFGRAPVPPYLPDVINLVEACPKPVIAALHGTALGGGLELALGCHFRIADGAARVGLPEVHLGLLPGAGGTQRLPRLTGAGPALDMILSGTPVEAARARETGIIDRIAKGDLLQSAIAFADDILDTGLPVIRTRDRVEGTADEAANAIAAARATLEQRARGLFAPFRIVEAVEAAFSTPFDEGLGIEREKFLACTRTPQHEGLVHAFFAERRSAKIPEATTAAPRKLETIGVVGGGTMGSGITVAALDAGLRVVMVERDEDGIALGRTNVEKTYDRLVARGRISAGDKAEAMGRYTPCIDYTALGDVDMVIEAVFEDMAVKKAVFAELDKVVRQGAVLASNTSYLDIDEIAASTARPADVIGLHFFSPAHVMKLLEIVIPSKAAGDVVATGFALARKMRKVPVRAGNGDGFIGNRILSVGRECASYMLEDGASPYRIDRAIRDFGYPMGLHQVFDLAGLDISWARRRQQAGTRDPNRRYVRIADRLCEKGWFGQKTGRGFYRYPDGARLGQEDPEVLAIIDAERERAGITPRAFTDEEIMRRYLAAMVNEGANVLEAGIALRPSDIDVVFVHGYGFPRYRGGPMKYADMYGLDRLLADIRAFEAEDPTFWKPSSLLVTLVDEGRTFGSLDTV